MQVFPEPIRSIVKYPKQSSLALFIIGVILGVISYIEGRADDLQIGLMLSLIGITFFLLGPRIKQFLEAQPAVTKGSYSERLAALTARLNEASAEVDSILLRMQSETSQQEAIVSSMETKLTELGSRKAQLELTIQQLEQIKDATPLVEELSQNIERKLERDEAGSRRREMIIFLLGFIIGLPFSIISDIVANLLTQSR